MGLLVISELDLGYHRLRAHDARAYWQLRLSGALHLDSPADGHPTEGSETPHQLQARVSTRSAPSGEMTAPGDAYLQDPPSGSAATPLVLLQLLCADVSGPELS